MKKFAFLSALFVSLSATAASISFTHFGRSAGVESYYACSYVEDQTFHYLDLLGATNIDVRCSGGIQSGWYNQPVSIYATFDLPVVTRNAVETVEIKGDAFSPACGINVRIIQEILKTMSNIQVLKKDDACAFASSNYYYKLNVTR